MPGYLIYGDTFLVSERLKQIESEITNDTVLDSNHHKISASDANLDELRNICYALPFLDPIRLVVIDNLMGTLDGNRPGNKTRNNKSRSKIGSWEQLPDIIQNMPDTTHTIFIDHDISKSNPLLKKLEPLCQSYYLPTPVRDDLLRWIKNRSEQQHYKITPAAIRLLADLVGNDLWTLHNELDKLGLYVQNQPIEENHVRDLVSQIRESSIFQFVDAIVEKRKGQALRLLHELHREGQDASYIFAMINRQLRLITLTKDLLSSGVSKQAIGTRLRINSQFVVEKTLAQTNRWSNQDIRHHYETLTESDLAIKEGRLDPDTALHVLIHDLTDGQSTKDKGL